MEQTMMVRFGVSLPDWDERELRIRAKLKGINRAALAADLIQYGLRAGRTEAQLQMAAIAKRQGISVEELEEEFLSGKDE